MKNYLRSRLPVLGIILGVSSPMIWALVTGNSNYIGYTLLGYLGVFVVALIGAMVMMDYDEYKDNN